MSICQMKIFSKPGTDYSCPLGQIPPSLFLILIHILGQDTPGASTRRLTITCIKQIVDTQMYGTLLTSYGVENDNNVHFKERRYENIPTTHSFQFSNVQGKFVFEQRRACKKRQFVKILTGFSYITQKSSQNPLLLLSLSLLKACLLPTEAFLEHFPDFRRGIQSFSFPSPSKDLKDFRG